MFCVLKDELNDIPIVPLKVSLVYAFGILIRQQVIDTMRTKLGATEGIVGAILCGFCMWGTHDQRSDVDCVVLYDFGARERVFHVFKEIEAEAHSLYVPAQIICVDTEVAKIGMHDITFLFSRHLNHAAREGGVVNEDPMQYLRFPRTDPAEDIREYIRHKLGDLQKRFVGYKTMGEDGQVRFLKKVLEVPMNLARKLLARNGFDLENDSKKVVSEKYAGIASPLEYSLFQGLTELDERYTKAIRIRTDFICSQNSYNSLLSAIENQIGNAIEFVRIIAIRFK